MTTLDGELEQDCRSCTSNHQDKKQQRRENFYQDGYVLISSLVPSSILQEWQSFVGCCEDIVYDDKLQQQHCENILTWLLQELYARGHSRFPTEWRCNSDTSTCIDGIVAPQKTTRTYAMGHGIKHGFREIVMRSPGRYEISLLNNANLAAHRSNLPSIDQLYTLLADYDIPGFLSLSSWDKVRVCNVSLVISTPGASTQGWHADGGHVNLQKHLPCHCLNVFIALHHVPTIDWGPTQLRPGTQVHTRNMGPLLLAAHCRKELQPPVAPLLKAGDALVFDYRLLHRGLANNTIHNNRSVLVATVAQDWFQDRLNFPSRSLFDNARSISYSDDCDTEDNHHAEQR